MPSSSTTKAKTRAWRPVAFISVPVDDDALPEEMTWSLPEGGPELSPIVVWPADAVPAPLWSRIEDYNDIDWVALVPPEYNPDLIQWLQVPAFGSCKVRYYPVGEMTLVVGHHA